MSVNNVKLDKLHHAWEKLRDAPKEFWVNIVLFVAIIIGAVWLIKSYRKSENKIWWMIVFAVVAFLTLSNMVYNRTEPAFLTPAVDIISKFLPTNPL